MAFRQEDEETFATSGTELVLLAHRNRSHQFARIFPLYRGIKALRSGEGETALRLLTEAAGHVEKSQEPTTPLRVIERTIGFDLLKITLLALCGASSLLMVVGAMVEATRNGMDPIRVLMIMPYLIVPTLPYTIPTSLLFSCTVVYGGMSYANEITAVNADGSHVYRVRRHQGMLRIGKEVLGIYLVY